VPAVAESLPGYEVVAWGGIVAPAGLPKDILARLNGAINKGLASPAVIEKYKTLDLEAAGGTPEQFAAHIRKEIAKWADVVRKAGIKPE
jgi:tripartite-type tricarboxylate transporter receptor subunit TctC